MRINRLDLPHAGVLAQTISDGELRVVVNIDDLDVLAGFYFATGVIPFDLRRWFAAHIYVIFDGFAGSHDDRFQVCSVDSRLH